MFEAYLDQQKLASLLKPRGERVRNFPRCSDRQSWDSLSEQVKADLLANGERALNDEYPILYVSNYMRVLKGATYPYQVYDADYFKRQGMVVNLALAECVANDGRFMEKLIDGIWLLCEESTWVVPSHYNGLHPMPGLPDVDNPWVDIHGARRGVILAEIAYLLEDKLNAVSPVIMQRVRRELDFRLVQPYLRREDYWWMGVTTGFMNNWCTWCTANILMVMMLLYDDPYTVALGAYRTMWILDKYLSKVPADGGCDEGITYWSVASGKVLESLLMLYDSTNGSIDLFDQPLIRKISQYPYKMHIQDNDYVNFADASLHGAPDSAIVNQFGIMTHSDDLRHYAAYLRRGETQYVKGDELFCTMLKLFVPYSTDSSCEHAPNEHYELENLQIYTWRKNGWFVAIKGGNNGESHNHNDLGHFILYRNGRPQIVDPGTATYTNLTFSSLRYTIWNTRANAHNIPLIGGYEQHEGTQHSAQVISSDANSVTYQLAKAYPAQASVTSYVRRLEIENEGVTLTDEIQQGAEQEICWIFILPLEPRWEAERACIVCPDFTMQCPEGLTCEIEHMDIDDEAARRQYENLWRVHLKMKPCRQASATFTIR